MSSLITRQFNNHVPNIIFAFRSIQRRYYRSACGVRQSYSFQNKLPTSTFCRSHFGPRVVLNMSIAEFLDGMPSFDERNFSRFHSDNGRSKRVPVYITTDDQPCDQIIVTDKSNLLLRYLHNQWDKKHGGKKRELVETGEEASSSSRKRPRVDLAIL